MSTVDFLAGSLSGNLEMLKMTLADFSEAEMLTRPVPGANHPLWQLGHLAAAETFMINTLKPGVMPELPAGFFERFENKKTNHVDDPKLLASKQQCLDLLVKARAGTVAYVKTLSDADLNKPAPEKFQKMCPNVGAVLGLQMGHVMMHLGQIQVARRKLGKPILF